MNGVLNNRATQIARLTRENRELALEVETLKDRCAFLQRLITAKRREEARERFLNSVPAYPSYRSRI